MEEDDGPKRRNSPVHADQAGMCELLSTSPLASMHALAQASSSKGLDAVAR